ncbi:hypothetical protein KKB18_08430, partial [bacterium]|nr:hypothetical protein [bacterium]
YRPFSVKCYDPGDNLELEIEGVYPKIKGKAELTVEKFIGGGFAGQVYKVTLTKLDPRGESIDGLKEGNQYAAKIITPPSGFSRMFRNFLYFIGFQGAFSPQVNYSAIRANVLWQKIIRRGAKLYLGSENAIVDTYATFFDQNLSSFGTLNEWVEGRIWRLELDDNIFKRWKFEDRNSLPKDVNSPEYINKRIFMEKLVRLFHDMGAHELARQYEWWTTKSQPNVLKKTRINANPEDGLIAIDFTAGLVLLPFLPMSPVDIKLIFKGLFRGSLVQFDRGNMKILGEFCKKHEDIFGDYGSLLEELKITDEEYRASLFDITHHHFKLLTRSKLRKSIKNGIITAWKNLGIIDEKHEATLKGSIFIFSIFLLLSAIPFLGKFIKKLCGHEEYRKRFKRCFKSWDYFCRIFRAKRIEALFHWHQEDRIADDRAFYLINKPFRFIFETIFYSWLPPVLHKLIAEPHFAANLIKDSFRFLYNLLTKQSFREEWLLEQIRAGSEEGMLSPEEEAKIIEQVKDPFIQKYLKCLAAHICTAPITQIISVIIAIYAFFKFGSTLQESLAYAAGILAAFQMLPITPGSTARGLIVLYLIIRERNIKNYWVAGLISFWHYIGYFGFPIQMVANYPTLARFMAGRGARNLVSIIPIFGEKGGLIEHMVFDLFFNLPLTIRRKFKTKNQ